MSEMIDMRPLKRDITQDYPEDAPIRQVILSEPDAIPSEEYAIKMLVWLKLIRTRKV